MSVPNVLIVDDEPLVRWALKERLIPEGYAVTEAGTAAGACEHLAAGGVALAILDMRLPDGNGLEILDRVKHTTPEIPVILMTAYSTVDPVEAKRLGACQFVEKPFDLNQVARMVATALTKGDSSTEELSSN
jgi:two-component system response regulator PilR (NtrC family)